MSDWQTIRADDYCDSVRDGTHDSPKPVEKGHRLITSKHIANGALCFDGANCISDEDYAAINLRSKVDVNDLLFSMIGTVGRVYRVDTEPDFAIKNMGLFKLSDETKSKYLYYFLQSPEAKNYIDACLAGSTQKFMSLGSLRGFPIIYPSDETMMAKIVLILDALTQAIRNNRQTNDCLHDICEAKYEKLCYEAPHKLLGEIIVSIESGSRPKGGAEASGIPSIGAEKIEKFGRYDYGSEKYVSAEFFQKLKRGIVKSGDVLLYKDGAYAGKVTMALSGFPFKICAINEHVFKLNTRGNNEQNFLYFTLANAKTRQRVFGLASSKAAQPGLNQGEIQSVEIPLPTLEERLAFDSEVQPFMDLIAANALESRELANLRDALLPKLMSGEIDVSNVELP